ncbi:MAG: hypothetical protein HY908_30325 [Myxococcales bacterium]|nr:hypothetical protein [Myxococcales bacterium]
MMIRVAPSSLCLVAALFVASLGGCHDIASWEVTQLTDAPFDPVVTDTAIELTEGTAIAVRLALLDADRYLILPKDAKWSVEGSAAVLRTSAAEGVYLLGASSPGQATLVGKGDAGGEARIAVTVLPQPSPLP